jgi:hypothetical protein
MSKQPPVKIGHVIQNFAYVSDSYNSALVASLTRKFVMPRQREMGPWFGVWRKTQPALFSSVVLPTESCVKVAARIDKAIDASIAAGSSETLIELRVVKRFYAMKLIEDFFRQTLIKPRPNPQVLLWWVPPLANSGAASTWLFVGQPDMPYLVEGIEDGLPAVGLEFEFIALDFKV